MKKGSVSTVFTVLTFVALLLFAYLTVRTTQEKAEQRSRTLTVFAQDALDASDFESAARFAMAAMKGHELPLIGFDAGKPEAVLAKAVGMSPALSGRLYFKQSVDAVAYSPDGKYLATANRQDGIQVWDAATHALLGQAPSPGVTSITDLAFTPDGHALQSTDGSSWAIQSATDGKSSVSLIPRPEAPASPAQKLVAEIESRAQRSTGGDEEIYLATSPDGSTVVTAKGRMLQVWNVSTHAMATRDLTQAIELDHVIGHAWYAPNGKYVAVNSGTAIIILDGKNLTDTGALVRLYTMQTLWNAKFSPDGERLAVMPNPSTVQIFNTATMETEGPPLVQIGTVQDVAFSPDGKTLAVAGGDWQVRFWDLTKGRKRTLDDRALMSEACRRILPGEVSQFREEELAHTPLLNKQADGDVCRAFR